jgi:uncharacterized protein (DUF1800 family)
MNHTVSPPPDRLRRLFPAFLRSTAFLSLLAVAMSWSSAGTLRAQVSGSIDIWPANNTVEVGTTKQFGAYVPINPSTVNWSVNGIVGGDTNFGTISASGLYKAPAAAPANSVLTIKAQSTAYPASSKTTSLTVVRPYPWLWSVSPSTIQAGPYSVSLNGSNFAPDSVVQANGVDVPTVYYSKTKLVANGVANAVGTLVFAVRQPAPGAVTGNTASVTVAVPTVAVAVSPGTTSVQLGSTQSFTAAVSGAANTAVTWSVIGAGGGSVTSAGLYTAPAVLPSPASVKVRATSVASPSVYGESTVTLVAPPAVNIAVSPASVTVPLGTSKPFTATVSGPANTSVTWSVVGGAGNGSVNAAGLYTPPAALPPSPVILVRATSAANALATADAVVTLVPPPVLVFVTPASATVQVGSTKALGASVTGTTNTAVTWTVLGGAANGTVTAAGAYVSPATMPASPAVVVRATSVADASSFADVAITLTPAPDYSALVSAGRFLEQATFGPTAADLALVQQVGIDAWLQQQFAMPATAIPVPAGDSVQDLQQWSLYNYTTAPDQLRQRVIYALSQIVVVSANKQIYASAMLPWMNILSQQAFGNYKTLLLQVSKSSSMGKYLDLANSTKPVMGGGGANENYARELMQLFTIGLRQLKPDGSPALDTNNVPIPSYAQSDVAQLALALTGWTYATPPGGTSYGMNNEYHGAPMETWPANHATGAKTFAGITIPAGQTVDQDLQSVIDGLFSHPNTAPFIATRLIRSLVKSNPSGAYVQRVADVFSATGGDMKATVTAILKDVEARNDTASVDDGRLKEPILHISGFLRALGGQFSAGQQLTYIYGYMAQSPLNPPSVFSWFSPLYHVPKSPLFGPEFQIYTPTEATLRGNLFHYILSNNGGDTTIDLAPFQPFGNDMPGLVDLANQRLLYGRMPAAMKQVIIDAAAPGYDAKTRIETVIYLTALSGQYAVQH